MVIALCSAIRDKPVVALTVVEATTASIDWTMTREGVGSVVNGETLEEGDPLAKPFVHSNATMVAAEVAEVFGTMAMAEKMRHSRKRLFRDTWWLWQLSPAAAHCWGFSTWIVAERRR